MPFGAVTARQSAPITISWTTESPTALSERDHWPSPTMCRAYSIADAKIRPTPNDTDRPLSARQARPVVESATATHTVARMCSWNSTAEKIGVATTYIPVTNPDTLAAVCDSPTVWSSCADPYTSP